MLSVLTCLAVDHDLRLVALAALVCVFACYTVVELLGRARERRGVSQIVWVAAAGTVMGCSVWATHFVAMLAFKTDIPIFYDIGMTGASIGAAVAFATIGFLVGVRLGHGAIGGAIVGGAVATMHYVGMAALRGPVEMQWDTAFVFASLVLGVSICALALHIGLKAPTTKRIAVAAAMLTLGICATHFTGMTALTLVPVANEAAAGGAFEPMSLAVAVAAVALLVIGAGTVSAMMAQHRAERAQGESLRRHIGELQATKARLESKSRELKRALADAAQASEAKSQFLAAMSHELRTPLNAVIGYSEFMQMEPFGPIGDRRYGEYVGSIHSSGAHLLSLINDILDLARLDAARVDMDETLVDLSALLNESIGLVSPQAATGHVVLAKPTDGFLPSVWGDARRLKQVLVNILANAVKFTPPGGLVTVAVRGAEDGAVAIIVTDTGIGMRPEDIPLAFERFGQVESALARRYQGTGLGLPLARDLTELHGGRLTLESERGAGTVVTILLPAERIRATRPGVARAA